LSGDFIQAFRNVHGMDCALLCDESFQLATSTKLCGYPLKLRELSLVFYIQDTFHKFWVLILWKISSALMASTDSKSGAGLHAEGSIAGSAVRNRVIPQSTASSLSPAYLLLVQNTSPTTIKGEELHHAPVSIFPIS
uniref:Aminotran_1_2 domain-containing protein n=1 Tax=Schistocephalus solidus TaxID=70667 RepID=A0A183TTQ8_SCHSO